MKRKKVYKIRKKFLSRLTIIMLVSCIFNIPFSGIKSCNNETKQAVAPADKVKETISYSKEDDATFSPSEKESLSLSVGGATTIPLSTAETYYVKSFSSSNNNVATVDDGGRVDGVSVGNATITINFENGDNVDCNVEVVQAEENDDDIYSTSITANEDIETENVYQGVQNPYAIYVNRKMNTVTVYTYDSNGDYTIPVRAMVCSCGKNDGTITGEFSTYFTSEWHALYEDVYGHYVSGISGDYLFHSVPFIYNESPDSLEVEEFNKLGTSASLGCVRLAVADSRWIFEHCAYGTYVKIYDDDEAGPLGKPETIKITDTSCGWDPTDSDVRNPYNTKKPTIVGATDITIEKGQDYDILSGVTALDTCSNDITDKITVIGNVISTHEGTYKVRYSVKDALKRTADVDITVMVK